MCLIAAVYFLLFCFLAWRNFWLAVGVFILSLPAYLIRFNIGPVPSTVLELSFFAIFFVWLVKFGKNDFSFKADSPLTGKNKFLFVAMTVFFLSSIVSIFVSDMWLKSAGQWRAYFLEPMLVFAMLASRMSFQSENEKEKISVKSIIFFLALSALSVSVLAIAQKFFNGFFPPSLWDDDLGGRVVSFFTSPNAIGLYLVPIVFLIIICWKTANGFFKRIVCGLILFLSLSAVVFSFSQGAIIAFVVGAILFAYFVGYKKTAIVTLIIGAIISISIPSFRSAIFFQDQAGQNRLTLWGYSYEYLSASPKNFILGTGIRQFFRKIQKSSYEPEEMERLIYPHNIFLNFWTETGFFGMISFFAILGWAFWAAYKIRERDKIFGAALLACLAVILIHGFVDVPYFKNDLAMIFWIIMAIIAVKRAS